MNQSVESAYNHLLLGISYFIEQNKYLSPAQNI